MSKKPLAGPLHRPQAGESAEGGTTDEEPLIRWATLRRLSRDRRR
ncbi:hypothetical protein [Kitasatospora sp. NBC_01300]|nr:hypothetical protein OG556_22810 [Kitasatospora sp. NBC_01300]